jgi:hypothetical protein
MQRAEMEELRHREANNTALQAIGPRKKLKLDPDSTATTVSWGRKIVEFFEFCRNFRRIPGEMTEIPRKFVEFLEFF